MPVEQLLIKGDFTELETYFADSDRTDPRSILVEAEFMHHKGNYLKSIDILQDLLTSDDPLKGEALVITGYNLLYLSREEEADELIHKIEKYSASLSPRYLVEYKILQITYAMFMGEFDKSGRIIVDLYENCPDSLFEKGRIYHTYGLNLHLQGKYADALPYYVSALEKFEELGNQVYATRSIHNIASVYAHQGRVEEALELYNDEISRLEELGLNYVVGLALTDIGNSHYIQGRYQLAKEVCMRSNKLLKQPGGSLVDLVENSVILIQAMIELGETKGTQSLLDEMEHIFSTETSKKWYPYYRLGKAMVLHNSGRTHEKAQALTIAEEILSTTMVDIDNYTLTLRYMIRFLLEEYGAYHHPKSLKEINKFIDIFLDTAQHGEASGFIPEFYLYKGITSIIDQEYGEAEIMLMKGFVLAQDHKLQHLSKLLSVELDRLPQNDATTSEPADAIISENVETTIARISTYNRDQDIDEELPVTFFIVNNSSNLLFSREFSTKSRVELNLVANFISALSSFAKETFSAPGNLERIIHGSYTILLNEVNQLIVGYVFEGPIYHSMQKIRNFTQQLSDNGEFWESMDPYEIRPTSISIIEGLVDEIFG